MPTTLTHVLDELADAPLTPSRPEPSLPGGLSPSPLLGAPLPLARVEAVSLEGLGEGAFLGADVRDPTEHHLVCPLRAGGRECFLALPLARLDEQALAGLGPAGLRDLVAHTDACRLIGLEGEQFRHLLLSARRLPPELLPS